MAFDPILSDQLISYVWDNTNYRNAYREDLAGGTPVFFTPSTLRAGNGYGGPRYPLSPPPYYTYDDSPQTTYNGNCTWWCCGRLLDALGKHIEDYIEGAPNAKFWYRDFTGDKDVNADNIKAGDIIVLTNDGDGHVMFVEKVTAGTVYVSQSAWSTRSIWDGYACRVTSYDRTDIYAGNSIDMYKDIDAPFYSDVVGVIHTGTDDPTPPTPSTEDLEIAINPSSYSVTMGANEDFKDFTFAIAISGIPEGQTVSGGNTYPDLVRVYNTGWSYTNYVIDGVTYRRATKTQTLRYYRESPMNYSTVKHMYYNLSMSTGSISSDTPMYITVKAKRNIARLIKLLRDKRKRGRLYVKLFK